MSQKHKIHSENCCLIHKKDSYLLYDPHLLTSPEADLLYSGIFHKSDNFRPVEAGGRGQAWFVEINGLAAVYRRYLRGGLISRLNQQAYFGMRLENSRSFKEWRLLQLMLERDLPVPRPIAASVSRWPFKYSPFYRAQILVELIPNVKVLDQILSQRDLTSEEWALVGKCIRQFHNEGIYHADLNVNNVLLNDSSTVYLIDFDKSEIRNNLKTGTSWKQGNLQRLKRSLLKQQSIHKSYHFTENNWQTLLAAYTA
ncbi:MAG: 3-deoxy-D-manno-octulosonic acid kinase [Gammaproteobacteria bacterium]|nr:3-deoxy-D-manno-octulosonic acid kinase [Gammaproteobacteria bacterium]